MIGQPEDRSPLTVRLWIVSCAVTGLFGLTNRAILAAVGSNLMQQLQPLGSNLDVKQSHSGHIAAWPIDTADQPCCHRIVRNRENDWNDFGCRYSRPNPPPTLPPAKNDRNLAANQIRTPLQADDPTERLPSDTQWRHCDRRQNQVRLSYGGIPPFCPPKPPPRPCRKAYRSPASPGCCARAPSGQPAAAVPRSVMNARRFIRSPRLRARATKAAR